MPNHVAMKPHEYRQIVEGVCKNCGRPMIGIKKRETCSDACRQAFYRARQKQNQSPSLETD